MGSVVFGKKKALISSPALYSFFICPITSLSCMHSVFQPVWHVIKPKATILWNVSIIILFKRWFHLSSFTSVYCLVFLVSFLFVFYTFEFVCVFVSCGVTLTQLTGHILDASVATLTRRSGNCSSVSGQHHNSHRCQLMWERTHFYLSKLSAVNHLRYVQLSHRICIQCDKIFNVEVMTTANNLPPRPAASPKSRTHVFSVALL